MPRCRRWPPAKDFDLYSELPTSSRAWKEGRREGARHLPPTLQTLPSGPGSSCVMLG